MCKCHSHPAGDPLNRDDPTPKFAFLYKIIYGLVAIDLPPSVVHPRQIQIYTRIIFCKYLFYPLQSCNRIGWRKTLHYCITAHFWLFQKGSVHHAINGNAIFFLTFHCSLVSVL